MITRSKPNGEGKLPNYSGLLNQEQLASSFLDSLEMHYRAQTERIQASIDNLLANTVGIDDHARIDNALAELFDKLANEKDILETIHEYRSSRNL